jgi:hypothetical protein
MQKSGKRKIMEIMLKNIETNNYWDEPYDKDERWYHCEKVRPKRPF